MCADAPTEDITSVLYDVFDFIQVRFPKSPGHKAFSLGNAHLAAVALSSCHTAECVHLAPLAKLHQGAQCGKQTDSVRLDCYQAGSEQPRW